MIRVETANWGQTLDDLRLASVHAPHRRTRERFQALYLIASGRFNATTCAAHIGRQDDTVLGWVHQYNAGGPDAQPTAAPVATPPFSTDGGRASRRGRREDPAGRARLGRPRLDAEEAPPVGLPDPRP